MLGRPTYLSSRVQGDVVVVGGDLFLRPGARHHRARHRHRRRRLRTVLGSRAVGRSRAIATNDYAIASRRDRATSWPTRAAEPIAPPCSSSPALSGLLLPAYDRVDGLSLPVGVVLMLGDRVVEIAPTVTYRSRLGVVDPGVTLRIASERPLQLERGQRGRSTRTNDAWIYADLINSATTFAFGNDSRNYFRADREDPLASSVTSSGLRLVFEPFVGGRFER